MTGDWNCWSKWLEEGYNISYIRDGVRFYERITSRDFAHYTYTWPQTIATLTTSGPFTDDNFEITKGYESKTNTNQFWQFIFGIKGQVFIDVELPTDLHRHGIPKIPKPNSTQREVSHFEEWMSPYHEPNFITEHFLMRPSYNQITFGAYNPSDITLRPKLRIFIAKFISERIGEEINGTIRASKPRWADLLEKLYKGLVACRPITLEPVRAPAEPGQDE